MGRLTDRLKRDVVFQKTTKRIREGSDMTKTLKVADKVGEIQCRMIEEALDDEFPNGNIPEDDVRRIISPILKEGYEYVAGITCQIIENSYEKSGIGLKAVMPTYNIQRENDLVKKISERSFSDEP